MTEDDPFAITLVPIDSLIPSDPNPQVGDIGAVATAIAVDGWHLAVLCRAPDETRTQPQIIAGHTRWRALTAIQRDGFDLDGQHFSYEELAERVPLPPRGLVPVQVQTMNDLRAARKLIADNRASALASTDDAALVDLLRELAESEELFGSLFDADDLDALIADLDEGGAGFGHPGADGEVECPSCGAKFVPGDD